MANRVESKMHRASVQAIGARFRKYLDHRWSGNQSVLAKALAVSQPAISRVTAGEQLPSGKLLLVLKEHTDLNLDWLLCGDGQMLLVDGIGNPSVPISDRPLPGTPENHSSLLSGDLMPGFGIARPTQYWLRVQKNDAITYVASQKVRVGDLLLLETDRAMFPESMMIADELWIVRLKTRKEPAYKLAVVSNLDGALLADTFEAEVERAEYEKVIEVRERAGEFTASARLRLRENKNRVQPRSPEWIPTELIVMHEDLVARKVVLLRR